ncbi:MAG: CPBP family intramembrane glutamic endopeptidase [Janthinobacterium lividum]
MTPLAGRVRAVAAVPVGLGAAAVIVGWGPGWAARVLAWIGITGAAASEAAFTALVFGAMIALAVVGGLATGVRSWTAGGGSVSGAAIGAAGLLAATALAGIAGVVRHGGGGAGGPLLLAGLATVLVQVTGEEMVFRGWLQPVLARATGQGMAVVLIAAAFAGLHALGGERDPLALANLGLGGLLFGVLAARGGGVVAAIGAHGVWNAGEQLVLGLDPNPGLGSFGSLADLDLVGAVRWGGSADGLNASWAMTAALLALLVPVAMRCRAHPGDAAHRSARVPA